MGIKNLIFAFICALFLVACGSVQSSPEKVALEMMTSMYRGDMKGVMKLIDLEGTEKEPGVKEMVEGKITAAAAKSKQETESKGGIKEIKATEKEIQEDKANILTEVTFKDGSTKNDYVSLIKKNGKWWVRLK